MRVNDGKSLAMNVELPLDLVSYLQTAFPFRWTSDFIPYLDVRLTPSVTTLYRINYPPLFKELEEDLDGWMAHGLFWLGKMYSVKMTLLPCLLHYFLSLPIALVKSDLVRFQSNVIRFVWHGKNHIISKQVLFALKTKGGLGLPRLLLYYQAAQVARLSVVYYSREEKLKWVAMEGTVTNRIPIMVIW